MGNKARLFGLVGATLIAGVAVSVWAEPATAQETQQTTQQSQETLVAGSREHRREMPEVRRYRSIPDQFNRAFYRHDGNFFDNRGIVQSLRLIFGVPNYVENSISQDGRSVDRLYKDVLEQQVSSDPVLRTPDLPNPYTGSVLTTPLVITEEPVGPPPAYPSLRRPPVAEPAPGVAAPPPSSQRRQPVPALW